MSRFDSLNKSNIYATIFTKNISENSEFKFRILNYS